MPTFLRALALLTAVVFVVTVGRLAALQKGGPAHSDVMLPGGIPGTFYLPGPGGLNEHNPFFVLFPPAQSARPPGVVLVHGFTADREIMSMLARKIAQNGYGVLAIDVRGHGENRNPFENDFVTESLRPDLKAAVDFVRSSDRVDGSRVVVIGHSMGAGATLDYASNDPDLKGAVMISGGFSLGPVRPKDALFIFAEHDPDFIQDLSKDLAGHLAGVDQPELGKTYGDPAQGTAVEAVQLPGLNHVTILSSDETATKIVKWLDSACGVARTGEITLVDPRPRMARLASILLLLLLIPIGRIAGHLATKWPERADTRDGWIGLAILAGALIAVMPLVANDEPAAFLSLVIGSGEVSWMAAAGIIAIAVLALWKQIDLTRIGNGIGATAVAAALAFGAIHICQVSYSVTFHRLVFTPERLIAWIIASALVFPFWLGFEFLLRRGGIVISTVLGTLGRAVIVLLLFGGVMVGIFPGVLFLIVPLLVLSFVALEVFAAAAYSNSRNLMLIAMVESMLFASTLAATNPIMFQF